jgi:F-type H+-transporting ATPase subunit b
MSHAFWAQNFSNQEIKAVINVNFTLFIQLINFLILLLLLNALLYKPILAKIREREAKIKGDRDKAGQLENEVLEQEKKHQEALVEARQVAAKEKAELLATAKKSEADVLETARVAAARIVDEMRASIQAESEKARMVLKGEMAPLAKSISEKILGRVI